MTHLAHKLGLFCAAVLIGSLSGCTTVHQSPLELNLMCTPACARNNLYPIFVASPVDALDFGGVHHLAEYVRSRGCCHSQYFELYSDGGPEELAARIREIKCQNPHARILLTGFSSGCLIVHDALCELEHEGVCVEGVCYLDSFMFTWFKRDPHPNNVGYTSLVYRESQEIPEGVPRSMVHVVKTGNHFEVPTHPRTVHVVMSHLCGMAQ